jgi:hypothetical protein
MAYKVNFLSFGNNIYSDSLNRIKNEALVFNIFDNIYTYNDIDLQQFTDFWDKHKIFLCNNNRGYGYWIWKSYLTLKTLEGMNDDDILVYADAGCILNNNGINRLKEYIEIVKNNDSGNISFQMDNNLEKTWTKMDIFNYFNIKNTDNYFSSPQLIGGIFIMRKCNIVMKIVNEWYEIMSNNYNLIDDSQSISNNDISFKENRHDQSIFSILRKKYGSVILSDETNTFIWNQSQYIQFPIWRKKT